MAEIKFPPLLVQALRFISVAEELSSGSGGGSGGDDDDDDGWPMDEPSSNFRDEEYDSIADGLRTADGGGVVKS